MPTIINFGGGASEGTAKAADVLAGKTFSNDDDTGLVGTMVDNPAISDVQSITEDQGNAYIRIPIGAHVQKAPASGFPEVMTPLSTFGDAAVGDVLAGKTFTSSAGLKASGTMPYRGTYQYAFARDGSKCGYTSDAQGNQYFYIHIPEGCYRSEETGWGPEARVDHADGNAGGIYNSSDMSQNRTNGQNDVKNNPNSYGLYTKTQYDNNWTAGVNNGKSQPKSGNHTLSADTRPSSAPELCTIRLYLDGTKIWEISPHAGQYNIGSHTFSVTN